MMTESKVELKAKKKQKKTTGNKKDWNFHTRLIDRNVIVNYTVINTFFFIKYHIILLLLV